jgi:hypothetical protein
VKAIFNLGAARPGAASSTVVPLGGGAAGFRFQDFGRWPSVLLLKLGTLAGSRWWCLRFFRLVTTVAGMPYLFAHQRRLTGRSR